MTQLKSFLMEDKEFAIFKINIVATDVLSIQGAKAWTTIVLTWLSQKSLV